MAWKVLKCLFVGPNMRYWCFFSTFKIIRNGFPILCSGTSDPFKKNWAQFSAHVHVIVWAFKINLGLIRNYGMQNPYQMYRHLWVKIMHSWWGAKVSIWQNNKKTTFGHAFRFLDFHEFWLFWFESKCKMFLMLQTFQRPNLETHSRPLNIHFLQWKSSKFPLEFCWCFVFNVKKKARVCARAQKNFQWKEEFLSFSTVVLKSF